MNKKSKKPGTITGMEIIKQTKPRQDIPFRTGRHMTEKDRPRKKYSKRDVAGVCDD